MELIYPLRSDTILIYKYDQWFGFKAYRAINSLIPSIVDIEIAGYNTWQEWKTFLSLTDSVTLYMDNGWKNIHMMNTGQQPLKSNLVEGYIDTYQIIPNRRYLVSKIVPQNICSRPIPGYFKKYRLSWYKYHSMYQRYFQTTSLFKISSILTKIKILDRAKFLFKLNKQFTVFNVNGVVYRVKTKKSYFNFNISTIWNFLKPYNKLKLKKKYIYLRGRKYKGRVRVSYLDLFDCFRFKKNRGTSLKLYMKMVYYYMSNLKFKLPVQYAEMLYKLLNNFINLKYSIVKSKMKFLDLTSISSMMKLYCLFSSYSNLLICQAPMISRTYFKNTNFIIDTTYIKK